MSHLGTGLGRGVHVLVDHEEGVRALRAEPGSGLGSGLEEVFVFDSKSENRDRAVEAIEAVPEARVRVRVDLV